VEGYEVGYCPFCGRELEIYAIDLFNNLLIWDKCTTYLCRAGREEITTDELGFIVDPIDIRGRFIHSRPRGRVR
jgi:hypothetical protein